MCLKLICFYASPGVISLISVLPEIKKKNIMFSIFRFFSGTVYFQCYGYHINRLLLFIALIV